MVGGAMAGAEIEKKREEENKEKEEEARRFAEKMNKKYNNKEYEEFENKAEDEYSRKFSKHPEKTEHPEYKKHLSPASERLAYRLKHGARKTAEASKRLVGSAKAEIKRKLEERKAYLSSPEYKQKQAEKKRERQKRAEQFRANLKAKLASKPSASKSSASKKQKAMAPFGFDLFAVSNAPKAHKNQSEFSLFGEPVKKPAKEKEKKKASQLQNDFGLNFDYLFSPKGKRNKKKPPIGGIVGGVPPIFG